MMIYSESKQKCEQFGGCRMICMHSWIYSDELLLINPPKKKKICSKCGLKETQLIGYTDMSKEKYEDAVERFSPSINNANNLEVKDGR